MKPWELESGPFTVYHLSDENGYLLYIGQSSRPEARILQHKANAAAGWTRHITSWEFFGPFGTRAEAKAREAEDIRALQPPWNSVHNPRALSELGVVTEIQHRMWACTLSIEDALREVISVTGDSPSGAAKRLYLRRPGPPYRRRTVEELVAYNLEQAGSSSLHQFFNGHLYVIENGFLTDRLRADA